MKLERVKVKVKDIKTDPNQPRQKINDERVTLLAKTFKSQGIINIPEIDENNMIITGEMRWRAAVESGMKEIECIRVTGLSKNKRLERQLVENIHHNILSSEEKEIKIKELWESGEYKTKEELGDILGLSERQIYRILKAYEERKELEDAKIDAASISTRTLDDISSLPKEEKIEVAEKIVKKEIKPSEARKVVKEIKNKKEEKKEPQAPKKEEQKNKPTPKEDIMSTKEKVDNFMKKGKTLPKEIEDELDAKKTFDEAMKNIAKNKKDNLNDKLQYPTKTIPAGKPELEIDGVGTEPIQIEEHRPLSGLVKEIEKSNQKEKKITDDVIESLDTVDPGKGIKSELKEAKPIPPKPPKEVKAIPESSFPKVQVFRDVKELVKTELTIDNLEGEYGNVREVCVQIMESIIRHLQKELRKIRR